MGKRFWSVAALVTQLFVVWQFASIATTTVYANPLQKFLQKNNGDNKAKDKDNQAKDENNNNVCIDPATFESLAEQAQLDQAAKDEAMNQVQAVRGEMLQLQEETKKLREQLQAERDNMEGLAQEKQQIREQLEQEYQQQIDKVRSETQKLVREQSQADLQNTIKEREEQLVAEWQQKLDKIKAASEQELNEVQQSCNNGDNVDDQQQKLQESVRNLKRTLSEHELQLESITKDRDSLKEKHDEAFSQLQELQSSDQSARQQLEQFKQDSKRQLQEEKEKWEQFIEKTKQELQEKHDQLEKDRTDRYNLLRQDSQRSLDDLSAKAQAEKLEEIEKLKKQHEAEASKLQSNLDKMRGQLDAVMKESGEQNSRLQYFQDMLHKSSSDAEFWRQSFHNRSYVNATYIMTDAAEIMNTTYHYTSNRLDFARKYTTEKAQIVWAEIKRLYKATLIYVEEIRVKFEEFATPLLAKVQPFIDMVKSESHKLYTAHVQPQISKLIAAAQPHIDRVKKEIEPHYYKHVDPIVQKAKPAIVNAKSMAVETVLHTRERASTLASQAFVEMVSGVEKSCPIVLNAVMQSEKKFGIKAPKSVLEASQHVCDEPEQVVDTFIKGVGVLLLLIFWKPVYKLVFGIVSTVLKILWFFFPLRLLYAFFFRGSSRKSKKVFKKGPKAKAGAASNGTAANGKKAEPNKANNGGNKPGAKVVSNKNKK